MAHCPCSNMRLGSGIAPVKKYLAASVEVGLGVDVSASNDASNILSIVAPVSVHVFWGLKWPPERWHSMVRCLTLIALQDSSSQSVTQDD
jgi:hypothetical protein